MNLKLDVRCSSLLRVALDESRFDPFEFFDDGAYPQHRAEKDEVEAFVAHYLARLDTRNLSDAIREHCDYLRSWVPDRIEEASGPADYARLCAFAALHAQIEATRGELMLASLQPPRTSDPVFDGLPELHQALYDGMLPLGPEHIDRMWVATNAAFFIGDDVVFPHPFLVQYRELLGALADLATENRLAVHVAIDPYRLARRDELQCRLLEDYWDGPKPTKQTLDSLDRHDQGASFHAAVGRSEADEIFNPLLGTWFDWRARADAPSDPIKRLYIREVKPATNRYGEPKVSVLNRELHAERNTRIGAFTHVDGKIARYRGESYGPSAQNPRADPGTPERDRKLWRVDGPLSDEQWIELVGLFYRGNELIAEHFHAVMPVGTP